MAKGAIGARFIDYNVKGPPVVTKGALGIYFEVKGRLPYGLPFMLFSVVGRGAHSAVRSEKEGEEAPFLLLAGDRDRAL